MSGDVPVFISAGEGPDDWEAPAEEVDDRFVGDAQIWWAYLEAFVACLHGSACQECHGPSPDVCSDCLSNGSPSSLHAVGIAKHRNSKHWQSVGVSLHAVRRLT